MEGKPHPHPCAQEPPCLSEPDRLSTALCVLGQHLVGPLLVCVVAQRSVIYILCVCSVYLRCMYVHVHVGLLMPHTGVEVGRNNRIVFFSFYLLWVPGPEPRSSALCTQCYCESSYWPTHWEVFCLFLVFWGRGLFV